MPKYWLIVASRDHVLTGVEGGFAQANHGKPGLLNRMQKGDGVLFYSGKEKFGESTPCQRFTAVGEVADDTVVQVNLPGGWNPHRRRVAFQPSREADIRPLISELSFFPNKEAWGFVLRRGAFEIPEADFRRIVAAMQADETTK